MLILLTVWSNIQAQSPQHVVKDKLTSIKSEDVKIDGYIGQRIQSCIDNRVMAQDIDKIIKPFQDRNEGGWGGFRCEYWGKWFTSATEGYAYQPTKEHRAVIDKAVDELIKTQSQDGYIGTYQLQNQLGGWDVWGRKYVLLGLIAYYDVTNNKDALKAASLTADYLISQTGIGKTNLTATGFPGWQGLPPSSILEPIVLLYQRTGEQKYFDYANYIISQWEIPNEIAPQGLHLVDKALKGTDVTDIGAPKAYEQMSVFEGLCEMYRSTGEKKYYDAILNFANNIRETEIMITGSGSNHELWFNGALYQTETLEQPVETCVTTTWIKLAYQMLRLTGNPIWADEMEKTLYNAMIAPMSPDGSWWAYYSPLIGERVPSHQQHPDVGLSCCVVNGPRGLLLTPLWAIMKNEAGPVVNLYAQGTSSVELTDKNVVKLTQETVYPVSDKINIIVNPQKSAEFTISLRIPAWSKKTSIKINGQTYNGTYKIGSYAELKRQWEAGDKIELTSDLRAKAVQAVGGGNDLAVVRGPVVLALDNRLETPTGDEVLNFDHQIVKPINTALRLIKDEEGYVEIEPYLLRTNTFWMAFKVPFEIHTAHVFKTQTTLLMCDYSSAGNAFSAQNLFRTWLPQPLSLRYMYQADTWKLMYPAPEYKTRPEFPTKVKKEQ